MNGRNRLASSDYPAMITNSSIVTDDNDITIKG